MRCCWTFTGLHEDKISATNPSDGSKYLIMMVSDDSECELPDLEGDYECLEGGYGGKPSTRQPSFSRKRSDFYSDSSDVEIESAAKTTLGQKSGSLSCLTDKVRMPIMNSSSDSAQEHTKTFVSKLEAAAHRQRANQKQEQRVLEREQQKLLKQQQKQQAEFEKSKKRILQETIKNSRPGECLKHLTVVIDNCILMSSCGPAIIKALQMADVRYEVEKQPENNMISFWREVTVATEVEPNKLEAKTKEVIEDELLIYVPLNRFLEMIDSFQRAKMGVLLSDDVTLDGFIDKTKSTLDDRNVTLIVQGLEHYFRVSNLADRRAFKNRVLEITGDQQRRKRKAAESAEVVVSRAMVEEAALVAQLKSGTCIKFIETDEEVAKTIMHFTKSVAEKPYKQELTNRLNSGYSGIFVEGCRGGTKVGSDGQGLARIWCQQLQQLKNVSAEVANAIAARYPSPRSLIEAYKSCSCEQEAESLLEDIVVRRGAGIVSTVRRVGKELSRRLYVLMTSSDGSQIIK